jgi:hypothetical protein
MTFPDSNAYPLMPDAKTLKEYGEVAIQNGCTKRELFAAMVYQGVISNRELQLSVTNDNKMTWQEYSVNLTDALIAELNKEVQS